jgi:hypothetical protein
MNKYLLEVDLQTNDNKKFDKYLEAKKKVFQLKNISLIYQILSIIIIGTLNYRTKNVPSP